MTFTVIPDWLQWVLVVGAIATAITALFVLFRKLWPALTTFVKTMNALGDLPQFMVTTAATLADQDAKIAEIHHETHENNGSSLKDANKRIEARLVRVERGVKGLYTRDEIDAKTAKLADEIERTRPPIRNPRRTK